LHGDEEVVYGDAGYQDIAKKPEMAGNTAEFRVAMRPGKRRVLPKATDGRLQDLIKAAKAHIRSKVEHPFRVIKQQFGFQNTELARLLCFNKSTNDKEKARNQLAIYGLIRASLRRKTGVSRFIAAWRRSKRHQPEIPWSRVNYLNSVPAGSLHYNLRIKGESMLLRNSPNA
jgi:hypothetical protein